MKDPLMAKKILSSVIVLALAWLAIFVVPDWAYLLVIIGFIVVGIREFLTIVEKRGVFVYKYFGMIIGSLIPVSIYLHVGENHIDMEPLLIVIACLFTFVLQFVRRENSHDHIISIAVTLLALFYISWFFS